MRRPAVVRSVTAAALLAAGIGVAPGWPLPASAQSALEQLVIVLRPPAVDELTREALSRISGELAAARFRVIVFPLDDSSNPIEQVETVGRDLDPIAAFALVRGTGTSAESMELWISDRRTQRMTIQRMHLRSPASAPPADVSRAAAMLAVESVELLRVSVSLPWPEPAGTTAARRAPPAEAPPERMLSLALGAGMVHDFGSERRTFAPTIGLAFGRPGGFSIGIAARGLGSEPEVKGNGGSARVQRAAAWLEVGHSFRPGRVLQPVVALGAGAEWVRASGSAADPTLAHDRTSWAALAVAGGGVAIQLSGHLALVLEVEGMLFLPPVTVVIAGQEAARFDRPSVLVDAGLQARF